MDNQSVTTDNKNEQDSGTTIDVISKPSSASSTPPSASIGSDISSDVNPSDLSGDISSPSDDQSFDHSKPTNPVLAAPSKPVISGSSGASKSKIMSLLIVLLIIIVFVGGVYGVYAWQHNKLKSSEALVTTLQSQVTELNKKLSKEPTTIATTTPSTTTTTSTTPAPFKITELGVEFTPSPILSDLTYAVNTAHTVANVSSQTLTDLDAACTANAATGSALGNITKGNGQFTATTGVTLIKQYPTYYISYTPAASSCSKDADVTSLTTTLTTDLKSIFSTIAPTS